MPASLMPDYHLGDLTKLVLLFSLAEKASANDVTIVTSNAHVGLSAALKMILETRDNNNKIFTVAVQESKTVPSTVIQSQTIISLILLDSDVTGTLASQWAHAKCLITCSALMTPKALTCLTFRLPDCDVCLVDTQLVYRPLTLRQLVPKVKAWLSKLEKNAVSTLAEIMHMSIKGESLQVFLRDDKLSRMLEFRELNLKSIPAKTDRQNLFSPNSVYIVVGGVTGLGWVCVKFLATHGARNIAIIQRRTPSPENRSHIRQVCSQSQCVVRAFQADVTSLKATESVLRSIRHSFENSPVKGIFFGAAVVDDGPFLSMNRDKFDRVLAPKVKGAWNVHLLTKHLPLDFFVMHSSMASAFGNQVQANYSTANAFLDGLAYYRRSLGLAAQSFSWGPLATGLLSNNKTGQQKLESFGYSLMSESEIYDILCPLLMLNWPHCLPVRLNEKQFLERVRGSNALSLLLRLQAASESYTESGACNPPVDVSAARSKDASSRLEIYCAYVRLLASRVLSVDQGLVTPDTNLVDLGLNSVSSMMLIDQIFKDTSIRLPTMSVLSGEVTVRTVSEVINDHIESLFRE